MAYVKTESWIVENFSMTNMDRQLLIKHNFKVTM